MMAHRLSAIRRPVTACLVSALAAIAFTAAAHAAPVFYLSTQNAGATPDILNLTGPNGVAPNSMGTLYLWINTDVRLSGIDLELTETGGGIKFTGAQWLNPSNRWALTGTPAVTNSAVTLLQGGAIPLVVGGGVGPGSPGTDAGPAVLLGSINYMANAGGTSQLALKVGSQTIADWGGNGPPTKFGLHSAPDVAGAVPGGSGSVGSIGSNLIIERPIITPLNLGEVEQTTAITAQLLASGAATWSGLTPTVGTPAISATLSSTGAFSWDSTGSKRGPKGNGVVYSWTATATGPTGDDTRVAISLMLIPEPTTPTLFALAMFAILRFVRSRH
jgi:hypothetical protein